MNNTRRLNQILWTFNTLAAVGIVVLTVQLFLFPAPPEDLLRTKEAPDFRKWKPAVYTPPVGVARGPEAYRVVWDTPMPFRYVPPVPRGGYSGPPQPVIDALSKLVFLNGIFASSDPLGAVGRAIVTEIASKKTHLLGVGMPVPGAPGSRVKAIHSDQVLVDVGGGREETLTIKKQDGSAAAGAPGAPRPGGPPPPVPAAPVAPVPAPGAKTGAGPADGGQLVSRQFNTRQDPNRPNYWYVDRREQQYLLKSIEEIRGEIGLQPVINAQNRMEGVRIDSIHPNSILRERGVVAGDIVRKINGIPITSQDQGNELFNNPQIRNAVRYDIEVERQGQVMTVTYDMSR